MKFRQLTTIADNGTYRHEQKEHDLQVKPPSKKLGLMLVGLGGNNGTTLMAGLIANKRRLEWQTRDGTLRASWLGSMLQTSKFYTCQTNGQPVYEHARDLFVDPNDIEVSGWDICSDNLATAMDKARVLEPQLKSMVREEMSQVVPRPSVYFDDFIAPNQKSRADNLIPHSSHSDVLSQIRQDIRKFHEGKEQVIVLWTATTERQSQVIEGVNDTMQAFLRAIAENHSEISPSQLFALACIQEGVPFINGSPQNTFVPGLLELAHSESNNRKVLIAGDDFKSGQTKLKACLVDMLCSAGIQPLAITSYNHLGNNDGCNLSNPPQFRSKEISKSGLVERMCSKHDFKPPDHTVVIKYVPAVGDSKRAMDEYYSEIFLGGRHTLAIHNTCEDSLLAAPLMLDLVLMAELLSRITINDHQPNVVMSMLSYWLKAPLHPRGCSVDESLFEQRKAIETVIRLCKGSLTWTDCQFISQLVGE